MANCVLVAAADSRTDELLGILDALPGVVTVPGLPLSNILFETARSGVRVARAYRQAAGGGAVNPFDDDARFGIAVGRAVLDSVLAQIRSQVVCRHVVLHDSHGLMFPLGDATGLKVVELVRGHSPDDTAARSTIRRTLNDLRGPGRFPNLSGYMRIQEESLQDDRVGLIRSLLDFLNAGE